LDAAEDLAWMKSGSPRKANKVCGVVLELLVEMGSRVSDEMGFR
jgi:hypothetical protein